ncbi:MAG TPA: metallopeptidase TldD-related protein, partial [Gammaproteobacteria bacterium]
MNERARFEALADALLAQVRGGEVLLLGYYAEHSDFARLNRGRVRQAGHVLQRELRLELVDGTRHAAVSLQLQGEPDADRALAAAELAQLRALLPQLPEDPYLDYATTVQHSCSETPGAPGSADAWLDDLAACSDGLDLVGLLAAGPQYHGFANSLGQRNWHAATSFNLDFSVHAAGNRAVKARYAGRDWDAAALAARVAAARDRLALLQRPALSPPTGRHRAYLAPAALGELMDMLAWGGFSLKSLRTGQSPLQRLHDGKAALHPSLHLAEARAGSPAPGFSGAGYVLPERVALVDGGRFATPLVAPRSAREYGVAVNARSEAPEALALAAGELPEAEVLATLGDGLYLSDLWYCNYSDRNACRITGMSRYACFVVAGGELAAPLAPMRFDASLYDLLGSGLLALTREREWLADSGTYERRA